MAKNRLNLRVSEDTRERLRTIALELGLKSEHGLSAGDGNISALLEAISKGEIQVQDCRPQAIAPNRFNAIEARIAAIEARLEM